MLSFYLDKKQKNDKKQIFILNKFGLIFIIWSFL